MVVVDLLRVWAAAVAMRMTWFAFFYENIFENFL
jgi:hypothetical protein